jgi:hypothetical protein
VTTSRTAIDAPIRGLAAILSSYNNCFADPCGTAVVYPIEALLRRHGESGVGQPKRPTNGRTLRPPLKQRAGRR